MNKLSVLILGSNGFIGSHLFKYLNNKYNVTTAGVQSSIDVIESLISQSDVIIHTIGVTRSQNENDFYTINIDFSFLLYTLLSKYENKKVIYFSSIHYHRNDLYGFSKRYNEYLFSKESFLKTNKSFIIRTPGIYGPGAKPNNVSVVSTFCYNAVHNLQSTINEPDKILEILFIDDLILLIEDLFENKNQYEVVNPIVVKISVIDLYNLIQKISQDLVNENDKIYNSDFLKNIISTYNSFKNATK